MKKKNEIISAPKTQIEKFRSDFEMLIWEFLKVDGEENDPAPAAKEIIEVCLETASFLCDKNRKYGNSALEPVRIFSRADTIEQIDVRIDDKLSRLKTQHAGEDEDVASDLLGYLILRKVALRRIKAAEAAE
jgi:hypothetical protein